MKSMILLFSAVALMGAARAQDTQAPLLDSISLSPAGVDVTSGAQTVTATLVCNDDDSGFAGGYLFLVDPNGNWLGYSNSFNGIDRIAGDELSGTYEVPVTLPEYAAPGTWRLEVGLRDTESNYRWYDPYREPFPNPGDELFTVVNDGPADTMPPELISATITPSLIDTETMGQEITISLDVTDDFSGVSEIFIDVYDPDYEYSYELSEWAYEPTSGDSLDGTYEIVVTIPQGSLDGTWTVEVGIYDEIGYSNWYYDETFEVSNGSGGGGGGTDTSGPLLVGINSITPNPVDITSGSQTVTVNFDLSDDSSGFDYGWVNLLNPGGDFVETVRFDEFDEVVSTGPLSGTYEVIVPIPAYGPPGQWALTFGLNDYAGNLSDYPYTTSFPNPGDELLEVTNTGPSDTTAPVLNGITLTPSTVDTSGSPQMIDIELDVSDDLSGIRSVTVYGYDPNGNIDYSVYDLITGSATTTGPLTGSFEIPAGSMEGTWKIAVFLRDMSGNWEQYGTGGTLPMPNPGEEEFTVGPVGASTYDTFAATYGLSGSDAALGANPDGDPFINILELLLGLDPTSRNPVNPALYGVSQSATELQLDFTIDPTLTVQVNGDHLEVSNGVGAAFSVTGQTSANLAGAWVNQLPASTGGTSYRVSLPFGSGDTGFIRLDFSEP